MLLLYQGESSFQVNGCTCPQPLKVSLTLSQVARVSNAMIDQLTDLAFNGAAQAIECLELRRLLSGTCLLEQRFMCMRGHCAPMRLAAHATLEARTSDLPPKKWTAR